MEHTGEVRRAERRRGGPHFLCEDVNRPHRSIFTPLVLRWKLTGSVNRANHQFTDEMEQGYVNGVRRRSPTNLAHWFHCTGCKWEKASVCRAVSRGSWAGDVNRVEESHGVSALIPLSREQSSLHRHLGVLRRGVGKGEMCHTSV